MRLKHVLMAIAVVAVPAQAAGAGEPHTPSAHPDGHTVKPICKREVVLGSRLPGPRVCKTAEQWKENDREAQDATRQAQENRRSMDPGAG